MSATYSPPPLRCADSTAPSPETLPGEDAWRTSCTMTTQPKITSPRRTPNRDMASSTTLMTFMSAALDNGHTRHFWTGDAAIMIAPKPIEALTLHVDAACVTRGLYAGAVTRRRGHGLPGLPACSPAHHSPLLADHVSRAAGAPGAFHPYQPDQERERRTRRRSPGSRARGVRAPAQRWCCALATTTRPLGAPDVAGRVRVSIPRWPSQVSSVRSAFLWSPYAERAASRVGGSGV